MITESQEDSGQQNSWSFSSSEFRKLTNQTDKLDNLLSVRPPKKRPASPQLLPCPATAQTLLDSEGDTLPEAMAHHGEEEGSAARCKRPGGGDDLETLLRRIIKEECGVRLSTVENTERDHEDRILRLEAAASGGSRGSWASVAASSEAGSASASA